MCTGGFFICKKKTGGHRGHPLKNIIKPYLLSASLTATAGATVIPTMGLLPAPIRPIISTWAGTEEEPANRAKNKTH